VFTLNFSDRLKLLRKELGLTQEELAHKLNKTRSTIAGYETERKQPDYETLKVIADFFNVSTDYLLERTNNRNSEKFSSNIHYASEELAPYASHLDKNKSDENLELSVKDEKDIAKQLEKTMELLNKQDSIMFDGEAMDEETKDLLRQSLENSMRMAKAINKKYTPKKHRK